MFLPGVLDSSMACEILRKLLKNYIALSLREDSASIDVFDTLHLYWFSNTEGARSGGEHSMVLEKNIENCSFSGIVYQDLSDAGRNCIEKIQRFVSAIAYLECRELSHTALNHIIPNDKLTLIEEKWFKYPAIFGNDPDSADLVALSLAYSHIKQEVAKDHIYKRMLEL